MEFDLSDAAVSAELSEAMDGLWRWAVSIIAAGLDYPAYVEAVRANTRG